MTSGLTSRLQDIPGVASVAVDLTDSGGGINVRLEPGADETVVMDRVRSLLVTYGVRSPSPPLLRQERSAQTSAPISEAVDVKITPIDAGARVEVATEKVKSFRVVAATPAAIAQGLADAWCQVIGRIPIEIVGVSFADDGMLRLAATDGEREVTGSAQVAAGWESGLTRAVGAALDGLEANSSSEKVAVNS